MSLIDYIYPEQCGSAKILGQSSKYRGKLIISSMTLTAMQSSANQEDTLVRPVIDSFQN